MPLYLSVRRWSLGIGATGAHMPSSPPEQRGSLPPPLSFGQCACLLPASLGSFADQDVGPRKSVPQGSAPPRSIISISLSDSAHLPGAGCQSSSAGRGAPTAHRRSMTPSRSDSASATVVAEVPLAGGPGGCPEEAAAAPDRRAVCCSFSAGGRSLMRVPSSNRRGGNCMRARPSDGALLSELPLGWGRSAAMGCPPTLGAGSTCAGTVPPRPPPPPPSLAGWLLDGCALAPPPSESSLAITCPTSTFWSADTMISARVPAWGARTSIVTLSVSICAMTSSSCTASPADFEMVAMVPSVMESPMLGTTTFSTASGATLVRKPLRLRRTPTATAASAVLAASAVDTVHCACCQAETAAEAAG
mmetsp:Transcript_15879/g.47786  ORF Transcript_15879/g.47786 Transcript_15879/m.47786 type:complete len:361 (+) Transcript_15879:395-1477(+)